MILIEVVPIKYQELYNEYVSLLHCISELQQQVQMMPRGYMTVKKISGKEYHYLQYTAFGKKKSEYIREAEVDTLQEKLTLGETLRKSIEAHNADLHRLEAAAKILDEQLSRTFSFLRQCAEMDALPICKRDKVLSFARAMTALEGLPARSETEENLQLWAKGEKSFADFYLPALQAYRVMEESI